MGMREDQSETYSRIDLGRGPNELPPDSADEEYNMQKIVKTFNANSMDSELDESKVELENRERYL